MEPTGTTKMAREMKTVKFSIKPVPPFRLDLTAWALRRRPDNIVDRWDGSTYRRVLMVGNRPVEVAVEQTGPPDEPELRISVMSEHAELREVESEISGTLDRMLGLKIDLSSFYRFAQKDPNLAPLAQRFKGVRPPRFPTVFETVVNGIACQQVTLSLGIHFLNRLAETYGPTLKVKETAVYAFPRSQDLARRPPEDLQSVGLTFQKSRAAVELSEAIVSGRLNLEDVAFLDDETAVKRLDELRGVGRWTAEYVLLRGLGRLNIFPGDDVGARNNLKRWLGVSEPLDYEGVRRTMAPFQPYAGLVYFHLLLDKLAGLGYLQSNGI